MYKKLTESTLFKAQLSAFTGGVADYIIMVVCMEFFYIDLVRSIIIANLLGALVNFSINRYWTYKGARQFAMQSQLIRFYFVVGGSIFLKSYGTYFFTNSLAIDYKITRLLVDLVVSLGWNFTLQKYWVFRQERVTA